MLEFDHSSRDVEQFNNELSLLLNHFKLVDEKALKSQFINKMTYIIELLNKNDVQTNLHTNAKVFEYAVISRNNDLANSMLKQVTNDQSEQQPFSPVDPQVLQDFYSNSLRTDNFNGVIALFLLNS